MEIYLDGEKLYGNIWYNYQVNPKPAGYRYRIKLEKQEVIKFFKEENKNRVIDKILKNKDNNLFGDMHNLLHEWNSENQNLNWVFNNIDKVYFDNSYLIMEGVASKAYDSYEEFHEACKKNGK